MQAISYKEYGSPRDVLALEETDLPVAGDVDVVVRVRAACVNPYDWHLVTGLPYLSRTQFGLRGPKVNTLGADFAGQVTAVGKNVTRLKPGDEVFGEVASGAFAEYVRAPESTVVAKPSNLTFEQAAAIPMVGLTGLQGLRDKGRLEPEQTVLINGASGGVGTAAIQIAKSFDAEVTGVCSTTNVEMVRSIGADHVIDYTETDFTHGDRRYDLVFDLVGNHPPSACRRALKADGIYVASYGRPDHLWLGPMAQLLTMFAMSPFVGQKMTTFVANPNEDDLLILKDLAEAEKLTAVIDRTYPLSEVPEALAYLETERARGKVVITV